MKVKTLVFSFFLVLGFIFSAVPDGAQAQEQEMGCCQFLFDGEPGGCMYPSDAESCGSGKIDGEYVPGADCNMDTGMCEKSEKKDSSASE